MQGWVLRRCLSSINRISSRTHRPKDPEIRAICEAAGTTWPEPTPKTRESKECQESDTFSEEDSESELGSTDEEVEPEEVENEKEEHRKGEDKVEDKEEKATGG